MTVQIETVAPPGFGAKTKGTWSGILRRYGSVSWSIVIPGGFLLLLVLACFLWPIVGNVDPPVGGNIINAGLPPFSPGHIFGTDTLGNDVFSRILYGGRVSIEVGLGSNLIGAVLGGGLGSLAGYKGGKFEAVVMRALDVLLAFPGLILLLVVSEYLGPSELHVIWAISFFTVPAFARISRAATLRLLEEPFVIAGRMAGSNTRQVIWNHIVPNVTPQMFTFSILGIGNAILFEAALSFLGLGVPPPGPSWGNMISDGEAYLTLKPDLVIIPGAFLFATVLAINVLGDAVRSRWNLV